MSTRKINRDTLAEKLLVAMAAGLGNIIISEQRYARQAVRLADALIEELAKHNTQEKATVNRSRKLEKWFDDGIKNGVPAGPVGGSLLNVR
jgi:hypothetical protein